jgi:hypothetical protein
MAEETHQEFVITSNASKFAIRLATDLDSADRPAPERPARPETQAWQQARKNVCSPVRELMTS